MSFFLCVVERERIRERKEMRIYCFRKEAKDRRKKEPPESKPNSAATHSFMILTSLRANTASTATLGAALRLARCSALPFEFAALLPGPTPRSESASAQSAPCSLCAARTLTRSLSPP